MWLEAIVSLEDFQALAAELLPVRVQLGAADSDHYLFLSAASEVSLVEGRGLRVVCNAQIRWPVLGMDLPISVDSLTVLLEPSVPNESGELLMGVQLEHADVAWVPSMLDKKIVSAINEALKQKKAELAWRFETALSRDFPLPEMLQPVRALGLKAGWGKVRVTSEAMVLAISFHAHALGAAELQLQQAQGDVAGRELVAQPTARDSERLPSANGTTSLTPSIRPTPATVALATAVGMLSTYFVARLAYGLVAGERRSRFA
jgi:hypothetical protein